MHHFETSIHVAVIFCSAGAGDRVFAHAAAIAGTEDRFVQRSSEEMRFLVEWSE
jgi:hypothetical protein